MTQNDPKIKSGGTVRTPSDGAVFFVFMGIGASRGVAGVVR